MPVERRDWARDLSSQQRREVRGKSAPSSACPATDNSGTKRKGVVLGRVLKRVSREHGRRRYDAARTELSGNARHALGMKRASGDPSATRPSFGTAGPGMRSLPNGGINPLGRTRRGGAQARPGTQPRGTLKVGRSAQP